MGSQSALKIQVRSGVSHIHLNTATYPERVDVRALGGPVGLDDLRGDVQRSPVADPRDVGHVALYPHAHAKVRNLQGRWPQLRKSS